VCSIFEEVRFIFSFVAVIFLSFKVLGGSSYQGRKVSASELNRCCVMKLIAAEDSWFCSNIMSVFLAVMKMST